MMEEVEEQYLGDNIGNLSCPKSFLEIAVLCHFTFRYIDKNIADLQDIVQIGFAENE